MILLRLCQLVHPELDCPEGLKMCESRNPPPRKVFFISSLAMTNHKCEWDDEHIEVPERLESILTYLTSGETDVLDECEILQPCSANVDDIRLVHSDSYIEMISKTTQMNIDELESFCSGFEDVYANGQTYNACMLSAGCALEAMKAVMAERNGFAGAFAAIRPPGHHASQKSACGFCFFNNVAICAKKARQMGVKRVLIVDWDVHAGQGTQYCIDDDENIRLISMHRYEYGKFWPQLPESAVKHSYANTLNVTLNRTGLGDAEYVAFMKHIVVPVIADFLPSLILVSCGFDASYGDPEGRMKVTPGAYQWMTHILVMQSIKLNARLCLLLEGGYFVETLPVSVEFCLKGLLGHPLPYIPLKFCDELFLNSVHTVAVHYGAQFPSLQLLADVTGMIRQLKGIKEIKLIEAEYEGIREFSIPYPTRGVYRRAPKNVVDGYYEEVTWIIQSYYYETEEPRKLVLYFDEKTIQDETSESVVITVDKMASMELVKQFLQRHVCEASLGVVEDISIKKSEFSTDHSLKKKKMTVDVYRATTANICIALLKIFDEGFASDLEHMLLFDC
uniref:Histone deacetylase 10 n=1 Tax=Ascaris suum TaxID=6253 RepID=F1KYV6_ASCSU